LPGAVVTDGDRDALVADRTFDIDEVRSRLMGMLDRVRECLRCGKNHLENLSFVGTGVAQPDAESFTQKRCVLRTCL
jgi:hypothetical protein